MKQSGPFVIKMTIVTLAGMIAFSLITSCALIKPGYGECQAREKFIGMGASTKTVLKNNRH